MKKTIYTAALLIVSNLIFGQTVKTEIGSPIVGDIGDPVLVMKNGFSVFEFNDEKTKTLKLTIFNDKLKQIATKELKFKMVDFARAFSAADPTICVLKTYEINGKIVIFIKDNKIEKKMQCGLYRLIINPNNAEIEKEELLLTVDKGGFTDDAPSNSFGMDSPFYFISKDDNSDYYAIIKYGYQKRSDGASNYEVHYYSPDNKEINTVNFDYVGNKYEYARPLNLIVYSDKYLVIASYAFNSEKKNNKDTKIVFSKLEKGKKTFTHKELDYSENFNSSYCSLKKNEKNNLLEALVYTEAKQKGDKIFYGMIFQSLDPEKMELTKPYTLPQKKLDEFVSKKCGAKNGYDGGMVDGFEVDANGNNFTTSKKNVIIFQAGKAISNDPELFGFSSFDANGNELNAWAYPHITSSFYKTICNDKGNFFLMDEMEENMDKPLSKKFEPIAPIRSNAIIITLKDNGEMSKEYIFGKPDKTNTFLWRMNYNSQLKSAIAVICVGKDLKNKKIARIKFE